MSDFENLLFLEPNHYKKKERGCTTKYIFQSLELFIVELFK